MNALHTPDDDAPTVLIVEDEAIVALDLQVELQELGYHVVGIADTAAQAIELARRHRPQLALMDILLKDDRDGISAATELRRDFDMPVVFLTSFSDAQTVQRAARAAAYGYLTKPYQLKELRAGLETALWKARMERQLRDADRWFALTMRCVQDGVVAVDTDARVRFLNVAAEVLTGWRSEEAAGRAVADVVRFEENDAADLVLRALQRGEVVNTSTGRLMRREVAAPVPVDRSAGPIDDDRGHRLGAVLLLRDAQERMRQQRRLKESEARFSSAFETVPLGMALMSMEGRFVQVNDALCKLLARPRAALVGQTQDLLTRPADLAHERAHLAALLGGGGSVTHYEKHYLAPDGTPLPVLISASIIDTEEQQRPTCVLLQVHDLSAQRVASERMAALASENLNREAVDISARTQREFLAHLSHEMRTPLNAVLGFAQLLQQSGTGQDRVGQYAEHIQAAGRHLLALVDDVLDLQRAADGSLRLDARNLPLEGIVSASVALLQPIAQPRDVHLELDVAANLSANVDETRLRQILLNLGSNAIKYNVHGGRVRFIAQRGDPGRVLLRVEDTGIGMTSEQQAHLFEPFNRLGREAMHIPGVGLGLAIARKLIEQMGGTMAISSQSGNGTVVTLDLPATQPRN